LTSVSFPPPPFEPPVFFFRGSFPAFTWKVSFAVDVSEWLVCVFFFSFAPLSPTFFFNHLALCALCPFRLFFFFCADASPRTYYVSFFFVMFWQARMARIFSLSSPLVIPLNRDTFASWKSKMWFFSTASSNFTPRLVFFPHSEAVSLAFCISLHSVPSLLHFMRVNLVSPITPARRFRVPPLLAFQPGLVFVGTPLCYMSIPVTWLSPLEIFLDLTGVPWVTIIIFVAFPPPKPPVPPFSPMPSPLRGLFFVFPKFFVPPWVFTPFNFYGPLTWVLLALDAISGCQDFSMRILPLVSAATRL